MNSLEFGSQSNLSCQNLRSLITSFNFSVLFTFCVACVKWARSWQVVSERCHSQLQKNWMIEPIDFAIQCFLSLLDSLLLLCDSCPSPNPSLRSHWKFSRWLRGDRFNVSPEYKEVIGFYKDVERDKGSIVKLDVQAHFRTYFQQLHQGVTRFGQKLTSKCPRSIQIWEAGRVLRKCEGIVPA